MVAQIDRAMIEARPAKVPGRLIAWALIEGRPLTTKGRWINPIVFALFRLAKSMPIRRGAHKPIYIIGTGRSGTTVLGKLFAIHKETVFLNEPKALWHYAHGEEDLIGSYSTGPARTRLGVDEATPRMARQIARIYSWAMRWGGARRVVDKYPELVFRVPFVLALFPQARFVALFRDGVDACSSVRNWSQRNSDFAGDEVHDWWGRDDRKWNTLVNQIVPSYPDLAAFRDQLLETEDHIDRAALEWIVSMRELIEVREDYPEVLAINYELLCRDTPSQLDRMTQHCGLEPDPVFTKYATAILEPVEPYGEIEIMPALVTPFKEMLKKLGYEASLPRIKARQ